MKMILMSVTFGVVTFIGMLVSIDAKEEKVDKVDKSFSILMAARNAAKDGLTEKAIKRYEAYLEKKPKDNIVKLEIADFFHNLGHYAKAERHYESLVQKMGDIPEADGDFKQRLLLGAARNAVQNKKEERAVELYDQAPQYGEVDARVELEIADFFQDRGHYTKAERHYENLVQNIEDLKWNFPIFSKTGVFTVTPEVDDDFKQRLLLGAARNAVQNKKEERAVELYDQVPQYGEVDARVELEIADFFQGRGHYAKAERHYESLVQKMGDIPEADDSFKQRLLLGAARNAVQNKKEERAEELYNQAPQYGEVDARVELEIADFFQDRGHYAKAERHYESLIQKMDDMPEADGDFKQRLLLGAARNAVQNKKEERAVELYDQAPQYGEVDAGVELEVADFFHNLGHYAKAERHYESLVQKMGDIPEADDGFKQRLLLGAARNAVQNKKEERAVALYDQAPQYGEVDAGVELEIADFFQGWGHYAKAERHYESLIQKMGDMPEADDGFKQRLLLGAARNAVQNKKEERAVELYDQVQQYGEVDARVELEIADFFHNLGHYAKAERHYESLIQKMDDIPEADGDFKQRLLLGAARNAVQNKKEERAVELYDQVLLGKIDLKVVEELAGVLARFERFDETIEMCEKILLNDPLNLEILTLKVNILVHLRKYSEARETLAGIPYKEKNIPKLMQLEADIEAWSGNYDVAIEKYKKLVEQFPEDGDIWAGYFKVLSWAKEWSLIVDFMQEGRDKIVIVDDVRAVLAEAYLSLGQEEKAVEAWKGIHVESIVWRTTLLKIVDKFLSRKNLTGASNILEEALSDNKHEAYLVAKLAVVYTYQQMPGKGFEILNQFPVSHQTKYIIDIAKVEILSLTGRYEEALSLIRTLELKEDKEIGLRGQVVELECYYAMEEDEKLIEKSSLILRELYTDELFDKAKVLTLHILSQIRMGLYEESEEGIEWLSEMQKGDLSPAILTVMLNDERRDLEEYEKSIRVLGELLSKFSPLTEIVRPKLLDNIPQSAWKIADEFALRLNQEVTGQLAKAELKIGNFQKSLDLFEELYEKSKDPEYKLGMLECYLNLENEEEIDRLFEEIQIIDLSREEIVEYLWLMVKAKRSKQNFYAKLSLLPKDVSRIITVKALTIIINIQSGDYEVANELIGEYLSDPRGLSIFQVVAERIGYFDKGEISENYEFARDWLYKAVKLFPDDTGLRYQYAKQLATHKEYDLAIEQFLILQKDIPENVKILRWLAQINSWKQEYDESLKLYDLYVRKRPADFKRRREVARVNGWALRRKESEEAYRSLCEDSPGDYETAWEWEAKRNNWLGRKRNAISFYNKLIERHPEDPELMFDLGQMYSMLNFSVKAEDYYKKLLAYAPEHSRAAFAKESEQWRRKQSISLKPSYIRRDGGGDDFGSINITMYRTGIEYSPVRLSEAMDLSLGVGHTIFKFKGNDGADAQHLTLNLNKGFRNGVSVDFAGELSSYSENPHETAQFDVDVNYKLFGIFSISLLGGREDVLQNNITLNDSRGRYYAGGRVSWDISERIDISGQAKQYWYNDSNVATEYFAFIGYKFTLYPKIFKLIIESYGFDVRSRRPEYWTPVKYRQYIAGLSWKHYLGKEHYNGAPKLFYEIAITQAVDVNGVDFMMPKFQCGWDNQRHWSMGFEFKPMRSTVYDEDRVSMFFKYRF